MWAIILDVFVLLLCLTDYFDGRLARSLHIETDEGRVFDPIADKVLVVMLFLILFSAGRVRADLVVLVIVREFIVMGLRELALMKGASIPVSLKGKCKTGVQMFFCVFQIINPCFYGLTGQWNSIISFFEQMLGVLIIIVTIQSMIDYFETFRFVTKKSMQK